MRTRASPSWAAPGKVWDLDTDLDTGAEVRVLQGHTGRVPAVTVGSVGGRVVAVSGGDDGTARVWDPDTGSCSSVLPVEGCQDLALAQDRLVIASQQGVLALDLTLSPAAAR